MLKTHRYFKIAFVLFLLSCAIALLTPQVLRAASSSKVDVSVQSSVCGNGIAENGEDCDGNDHNGKSCTSLGFSGGNLSCNSACGFITTACNVPVLNANRVEQSEVYKLAAAGLLNKPVTDHFTLARTLLAQEDITIVASSSRGQSSVRLPQDCILEKIDSSGIDPTQLAVEVREAREASGFPHNVTVEAPLIQWGLPTQTLEFTAPLSIELAVGSQFNGQTLTVYRSPYLDSGWTTDGIVSPGTCEVAAGLCRFQTTKASYFAAATVTTAATSPTPTTQGSTNETSSNTNTSSPTPSPVGSVTPTPVSKPANTLRTIIKSIPVVESWVAAGEEILGENIQAPTDPSPTPEPTEFSEQPEPMVDTTLTLVLGPIILGLLGVLIWRKKSQRDR